MRLGDQELGIRLIQTEESHSLFPHSTRSPTRYFLLLPEAKDRDLLVAQFESQLCHH